MFVLDLNLNLFTNSKKTVIYLKHEKSYFVFPRTVKADDISES